MTRSFYSHRLADCSPLAEFLRNDCVVRGNGDAGAFPARMLQVLAVFTERKRKPFCKPCVLLPQESQGPGLVFQDRRPYLLIVCAVLWPQRREKPTDAP